jgi:hypothetical protein
MMIGARLRIAEEKDLAMSGDHLDTPLLAVGLCGNNLDTRLVEWPPICYDLSGAATVDGDPPWTPRFITLLRDILPSEFWQDPETGQWRYRNPAGWVSRPGFTGAAQLDCPRLICAGTRFETFAFEAAALVAAGVAEYS